MPKTCQSCGQPLETSETVEAFCAACALDSLLAKPEPSAGAHRLVGEHEILEEIAKGGMGVVYRARHRVSRREVALKMLLPMASMVPELRQRFRQEILALAELDFPGILPLYETGEQDGVPYFTMKLALGGTLAERLKAKALSKSQSAAGSAPSTTTVKKTEAKSAAGRSAYKEIAELIANLADAVHYANQRGILHRDIKPANILFDENGQAFLADFGLAKMLDEEWQGTLTQIPMGTPCYMAPEVAKNGAKNATAASDIYGLGAVLYEMLAGRPPFIVQGMAAMMQMVVEQNPEAPSTLARGVPRDLEIICLTCLAKDPRKRYSSAAALAEDLRRWLAGEPITARRVGLLGKIWAWAVRRPTVAGLVTALVASFVGSGVWVFIQNKQLVSALADAKRATKRANERIEFILGEFGDELEDIGRVALLEKALLDLQSAYEKDPTMTADSAGIELQARALARLGKLYQAMGNAELALQYSRSAGDKLLALYPKIPDHAANFLTDAKTVEAYALRELIRIPEGLAVIDAALRVPGIDEGVGMAKRLARLKMTRAQLYYRLKDDREAGKKAREAGLEAVGHAREYARAAPQETKRQLTLAEALRTYGYVILSSNGLIDRDSTFEDSEVVPAESALAVFDEAAALTLNTPVGATPAGRLEHAKSLYVAAYVLRHLPGRIQEALAKSKQAYQTNTKLVAEDPVNKRWQLGLAEVTGGLASDHRRAGDTTAEMQFRKEAAEIGKKLTTQAEVPLEWIIQALRDHLALGETALRHGDEALAAQAFADSMHCGTMLVERRSDDLDTYEKWFRHIEVCANRWAKHEPPNLDRARECYFAAMPVIEKHLLRPNSEWWLACQAKIQRKIADLFAMEQRLSESLDYNKKALAARISLLQANWEPDDLEGKVHHSFEVVAKLHLAMGDYAAAIATAKDALRLRHGMPWLKGKRLAWADLAWLVITRVREAPTATPAHQQHAKALASYCLDTLYGENQPAITATEQNRFDALMLYGKEGP